MKILIVQTSFLGDTILSTPVIAGLKKLYPDSELWMLTTALSKDLVKFDPLLKGVISYDKRGKDRGLSGLLRKAKELRDHKFDRSYSIQRSYRTALLLKLAAIPGRVGFKQAALSFLYTKTVHRDSEPHDVLRNLSLLSTESEYLKSGKKLEDYFDSDLRLFSSGLDPRQEIPELKMITKPIAIVVPGSAWKTKRWNWKGFRETAEYLIKGGYTVVVMGAASEKDVCDKVANGLDLINLAGKTTIAQGVSIVKTASLLICNDSMALHMASALKVPNVAVFCATSPKFGFGPWKNKALVVEKEDLSCKPCRRHGGNTCPTGTEACMNELRSGQVITAIEKIISMKQD